MPYTRNDFTVRISLLALLLWIPNVATAQENDPVERVSPVQYFIDYTRATALHDAGLHTEATPILMELVRRSPGDASLWLRLGRSLELLGEPVSAINAYRKALELGYRKTPSTAYRVARLFAITSQPDSAFSWLEHALDQRYDNRPGIANDPAFESLRGDPHFARITGRLPDREFTRDEGWVYDLDFLVSEARRMHAAPERRAYSAAFDSAAAVLRARIPELSNERVVIEMQRLMTLLGDGHSVVYGAGPDSPLEFRGVNLPVLFYLFDDGLHIVDAAGAARRWIGARVLEFGPRPADEVLSELSHYVNQDNPVTPTWLGVHYHLRSITMLEVLGATTDPSRVTLTLRDPQGEEHRVVLEGGGDEFPRKLQASSGADSIPLYLGAVDRNYWIQAIPEVAAIYWQFNQVRDTEGGPSVDAFADTLRATLERLEARNLIIDVRHNNGGNNGLLDPLLRTLVWWEQAMPERRIFVITGRNTFSAAQNFINRVERMTDAVFVGEPSSSRPNFTGEETNLLLPFSRVVGSISTMHWQDSEPNDVRFWIAPQIPVPLSSDDYLSGHDPALAAILEILAASI